MGVWVSLHYHWREFILPRSNDWLYIVGIHVAVVAIAAIALWQRGWWRAPLVVLATLWVWTAIDYTTPNWLDDVTLLGKIKYAQNSYAIDLLSGQFAVLLAVTAVISFMLPRRSRSAARDGRELEQ